MKLGVIFGIFILHFIILLLYKKYIRHHRKTKEGFQDSKSLFQDIWFINMDKSTERREYMEKMLRDLNLGVQVNRWPGINGHLLTNEDYNKLEIPAWARPEFTVEARQKIRKGELGCYLSHLALLKHLATLMADAHKGHLILEDDIQIENGFMEKVKQAFRHVPTDWDIITFGIAERGKNIDVINIQNNIGRTIWMNNDYAYLVKHSSLEKIINEVSVIREPFDTTLGRASKLGKLNIYSYVPPLVVPREKNDTTMNG